MQIQISTTNDVKGSESFDDYAKHALESTFARLRDQRDDVAVEKGAVTEL